MNILIVSNIFAPEHEGGAEKVARRAAETLALSHTVCVLTTGQRPGRYRGQGYDVERVAYSNWYPYSVGQRSVSVMAKLAWHLRDSFGGVAIGDLDRVLSERRPDVVYMHNAMAFQPQLGNVCLNRNIPVCAHLHDYSMLCPKTSMYRGGGNCSSPCWGCRTLRVTSKGAIRNVRDMIAVSEFVRDQHLEHGIGQGARWHVLHNVESEDGHVPRWRRPIVEDGSLIFGFIGSLTPAKGVEDLVDAVLALPDRRARLFIAGKGNADFVNPLKARSMGRGVTWLGHVSPDEFYNQVDCVVVPSRWHEPQALVVVEAINRGIPLIASDRGGTSGVVRHYAAGQLYDPGEVGALAATLGRYSHYRRSEWKEVILKTFPGLRAGGRMTEQKLGYFKRLTAILEDCASRGNASCATRIGL